jgi:hypothetical protein
VKDKEGHSNGEEGGKFKGNRIIKRLKKESFSCILRGPSLKGFNQTNFVIELFNFIVWYIEL